MVGHVAVAWDVAATKAAAGGEGGGGPRRRWRALLSPQLPGGVYDERLIYRRRGRRTQSGGTPSARSFCV